MINHKGLLSSEFLEAWMQTLPTSHWSRNNAALHRSKIWSDHPLESSSLWLKALFYYTRRTKSVGHSVGDGLLLPLSFAFLTTRTASWLIHYDQCKNSWWVIYLCDKQCNAERMDLCSLLLFHTWPRWVLTWNILKTTGPSRSVRSTGSGSLEC